MRLDHLLLRSYDKCSFKSSSILKIDRQICLKISPLNGLKIHQGHLPSLLSLFWSFHAGFRLHEAH